MSWAVTPFVVKEPQAVEALMIAFGKCLYLACEFERKCQYVLRILNLVELFETTGDAKATFAAAAAAKNWLLGLTIKGMAKTGVVTSEEVNDLTKAREARNYIV